MSPDQRHSTPTNRVHVTWDVVFDKLMQWDWSPEEKHYVIGDDPFMVEYTTVY